MTFPMETEANIKRRMLDLCQTHARNVVEITRQLALLVDNVAAGKPKLAKENYQSLTKSIEENEKNKTTFLVEVASVGSLLISREDFLRLLFRLGELDQLPGSIDCHGIYGVIKNIKEKVGYFPGRQNMDIHASQEDWKFSH